MSYILDALKRADSDREREAASVPDLHAQADAPRGAREAKRTSGWLLLAIAAGAFALAALAWRWFGAAPEDEVPPAPVTQAPPPAPAPAPAPGPVPAPIPPAPAPQGQTTAPAPAPATVPPRVSVLVPPPKPERPSADEPATAVPAAVASAPAAAETRLLTLAELPADIRSKLPALTVGGSMYSPTAKNRMVILNGQVFREGDKPVDGLSVEEIRLKSTVLAFRGLRFELKH